jgi:hypothetical protein
MAGVLYTGLLALAAVINALPQAVCVVVVPALFSSIIADLCSQPASGSTCAQLGNNTQVDGYTITCNTDRAGGDLSNAQSSSFSGCFSLCDGLAGCVGFSYVPNSGYCYFKSSLTNPSSNANVDVAVKPSNSSCAAIGSGNVFDGYTVTCMTDAAGGDLSNTQASSFAACAPLCDTLTGCIGFAYANG